MREQRLEKLLEMLTQNEGDTFVNYALAMEYLGLNQKEKAEDYFRKCIDLDEKYTSAYYQLALLASEKGEDTLAISYLEKGLLFLNGPSNQKTKNEFQALLDELSY
ncbi:MAG: hypothetical protein CFE21_14610 [Bacteroidetes bacterium B1(2017)]|nr:MAG: hypothetical protein CFE21_14610 [Bacteroidetes bacterium B1(2017)]